MCARKVACPNICCHLLTLCLQVTNLRIKAFSDPQFWEYQAKNLAMRRACGEYVLTTNPDVWLTDGFWQMVAARGFRPDMYYRMGRVDTKPWLKEDSFTW